MRHLCRGAALALLLALRVPADLLATTHDNAMLLPASVAVAPPAACTRVVRGAPLVFEPANGSLPAACGASPGLMSARVDGALKPGFLRANETYSVTVAANVAVRLWVRGWKMVDAWQQPDNEAAVIHEPAWNFTAVPGLPLPIRLELLSYGQRAAKVSLLWKRSAGATYAALPDSALTADVSPEEGRRQAMQRNMSHGWNTWHRASAASHVHLPSGFGVGLGLVVPGVAGVLRWDYVDKCRDADQCIVRPGAHTYNGSLTELTYRVPGNATASRAPFNVTVRSAHVGGDWDNVVIVLQANTTWSGDAATVAPVVRLDPSFFFTSCTGNKAAGGGSVCGSFSRTKAGFHVQPAGYPAMAVSAIGAAATVTPAGGGGGSGGDAITVAFDDSGVVCIAAGEGALRFSSTAACVAAVDQAARRHGAELDRRYSRAKVGRDRDLVEAMRAVIGWNCMYDMRTHVITPVSRNFGVQPFSLWLWDTYFSTLLSAEASVAVAYSNLLAVTRPTVYGDVPGIRTATEVATDRSKPFVGPLVLALHYSRFKEDWIVRLLYDDMLIWTNWVGSRRTLPVTNATVASDGSGARGTGGEVLVALASDNYAFHVQGGAACTTLHAIWESGLDNSPMYDGIEVVAAPPGQPCFMPLHDVGMTGLYLSMLEAMAGLAEVVGRPADAADLRARQAAMTTTLNKYLWNEELGVYSNRRSDTGEFVNRISPFNFHPMLTGAASTRQADAMATRWLLTDKGFCLSDPPAAAAPRAGGQKPCDFGLPAISHNDTAFNDQDYWRGRVWGPMNYLVYVGLAHPKYAGVASVQRAKKALAAASGTLLLRDWLAKGHVHENYDAVSGSGADANSNPFYHWGALLSYVTLLENDRL